MEEMQNAVEKAREGGGGGDYADQPVAAQLLKAAEDLELNLETMEGKKDAAKKFAELVDGKLDLPEGRNPTMEIGRVVMSNLDSSPKDIMGSIISKFGIKEVKEEKAAEKEAAAESACANPKNAPLILAFKECSKYYFEGKLKKLIRFQFVPHCTSLISSLTSCARLRLFFPIVILCRG